MKYGTLYGKDIEKMTKEELIQALLTSRNEINALHNELSDLYIKHGHLFLARSKPKNFLQKLKELWEDENNSKVSILIFFGGISITTLCLICLIILLIAKLLGI